MQGLGNVGWNLCALLHQAGAKLIVTDIDPSQRRKATETWGAKAVAVDDIYGVAADIFAPCAIGGILNHQTIPKLRASVVAGGANNQLATPQDALDLHQRGILYAPDFVANGGGIINVATEIQKITNRERFVDDKLRALEATLKQMLDQASAQRVSPATIAIETVRAKMAEQAA